MIRKTSKHAMHFFQDESAVSHAEEGRKVLANTIRAVYERLASTRDQEQAIGHVISGLMSFDSCWAQLLRTVVRMDVLFTLLWREKQAAAM